MTEAEIECGDPCATAVPAAQGPGSERRGDARPAGPHAQERDPVRPGSTDIVLIESETNRAAMP